MSQHSQNTKAIVINIKNNKENNLLLTLLTPNLGKISIYATGAKSLKSSRSSSIQLGNILQISLTYKNNFYSLSESQSQLSFLQIDHKLITLNLLFYFLEVLKNFAPENEPATKLFDLSAKAIDSLYQNQWPKFIKYQIEILNSLGFGAPANLQQNYIDKNYQLAQQQLVIFFESILEKPLFSRKLLTK